MINDETTQELNVTFIPQLFLQRRRWVFERMMRAGVNSVVDIGCGEGETVACLCNPAPWRAPLLMPVMLTNDTDAFDAEDTLHVTSVHALDVSASSLDYAAQAIAEADNTTRWMKHIRWEPLDVKLWHGGLECFNPEFVGVDCIISTEVIEHLPEEILPQYAPMLLGVYHPRLVLITTPSYTFNARFTPPDTPESARSGYRDPTGRTNRIFRHSDHKFEWTVEEFTEWCEKTAAEWGYEVEISGVGKAQEKDEWGRDDELGWASQAAAFRRRDDEAFVRIRADKSAGTLKEAKTREAHQVTAEFHRTQHEMAGRSAESMDSVSSCVKTIMQKYQQTTATVHEYWFEEEIGTQCGGLLQGLILALELDDDLLLHRKGTNPLDWVVEFTGIIRHAEGQDVGTPVVTQEESVTSESEADKTDEEPMQWPDHERMLVEDHPTGEWGSSSPINDTTQWGATTWGRSRTPESWHGWGAEDWMDRVAVETEVQA